MTDRLSAIAGVRYSHETIEGSDLVLKTSRKISYNDTSPRFGLNYQITDDALIYVSAAKGIRAGGTAINSNLLLTPNGSPYLPFGPETAWTYEAGARLEFLNRRLRINPTVFFTDWKNIQFNLIIPAPTGPIVATQNAGDAHIKGAELEAQFAATDRLLLTFWASTLDDNYTRIPSLTRASTRSASSRAYPTL